MRSLPPIPWPWEPPTLTSLEAAVARAEMDEAILLLREGVRSSAMEAEVEQGRAIVLSLPPGGYEALRGVLARRPDLLLIDSLTQALEPPPGPWFPWRPALDLQMIRSLAVPPPPKPAPREAFTCTFFVVGLALRGFHLSPFESQPSPRSTLS